MDKSSESILLSDDTNGDPYLKHVGEAVKLLINRIREIGENDRKGLADFIYQQVSFVKNIIPEGVDLNKLFSVMNNSGIQLEQTDILKSRLLKHITHDKSTYNAIWQVCENMDNYFEHNVCELFVSTNWENITKNDLRSFDDSKFQLKKSSLPLEDQIETSAKTIADIIDDTSKSVSFDKKTKVEEKYGTGRPIISFSQLLLHAYRIYLKKQQSDDFKTGFHANHLLEIFETLSTEKDIIEFLECLWQTRYYFDNNIVRWIRSKDQESREVLKLIRLGSSKNKEKHFTRYAQEEKTETMMLQSLLYFTSDRNRQYWLSSYLYHCMEEPSDLLLRLEKIDDNLSLASNKKEASYQLMSDFKASKSKYESGLDGYLQQEKGTGFEHYWFQKLEYILWKKIKLNKADCNSDEKFKQYRITSKNSVEHVFPQNEEYGKTIPSKTLNAFGNLTLLSVSQNSSYSNQTVRKKSADFYAKPTYDTLKLKCIFDSMEKNEDWGGKNIIAHQKEMIDLIQEHYSTKNFGNSD